MSSKIHEERALSAIVEALIEESVTDYRIDRARARELIEDTLRHDRALRAVTAKEMDLGRLLRTRAFREARRRARKTIYYDLRRYKRTYPGGVDLPMLARQLRGAKAREEVCRITAGILALHSSTRERLASRRAFDEQLIEAVGGARTVMDVGCGVFPVMFPFADFRESLELYLALDRDAEVIEALQAFVVAGPALNLLPYRWNVADGWDALSKMGPAAAVERFDVALLLKLVPVVARQEPELLTTLARTPARRLIVSGSRRALAKQTDIDKRERRMLKRWIEQNRFEVVSELAVEEEFAYVLDRDTAT